MRKKVKLIDIQNLSTDESIAIAITIAIIRISICLTN